MTYTYTALTYNTYNLQNYYAAIAASVMFFAFYVISLLALKYEVNNKLNICDPMFYYGRACRNQIADTLLMDANLVNAKHAFYDNVKKTIEPTSNADQTAIEDASETIQGNISDNANFTKDTITQIQEVTDIVKEVTSKYLGNVQELMYSTKDQSSTTWQQIQNIPGLLSNIQWQINQAIVTPTLVRYVDPLQKLYKSLSDIKPAA